ncbi:hypothetical protein NW754_001072 [Fusarium falciforme]|uniref:Hypothetical protein n=1 Tax=Fusarium falciforme TaxID=195108 RepID=UPI002301CC26|nr:Hypothetical protein NCS54_00260400 [Fusarium falciforme]KAJ4149635.1 hypothetical protein NW754_001072 [Fusarium falciforme]KAJ4210211.1 hypothetical protein NW767_000481 [Fusarium falciforme]KAJ4256318.1 hypothetical protein NW757_003953 [Fusarium falciforme]WAO85365.1 Hypothetical protein NCS54_00260400 [Fusarium falciforme]
MLHGFSWGGLVARASLLASSTTHLGAREADTYTEKASISIQRLNDDWYNAATGIWDGAWWNSGSAMATLADFTMLRLDEANRLNLGGIMRTTFNNAQKTQVKTLKTMTNGLVFSTYCIDSDSGCMAKRDFLGKRGFDDFINEFYDDEGWWALAWIRCHDAAGDADFLEAAIDLFNDMGTGAGTPCGGGIYWNKDRKYVNAIANELYLSVAASLARRVPGNTTYLEIAKKQWKWFEASGMINKNGLINDGLNGCKNNGLQTWSYNQGVILGGLVELALATGDGALIEKAHRIAYAAIKELTNDDGILIEADDCELKDGHCGRDGQQFKGIFIRNIHYLHKVSPKDLYRRLIIKNADSIWKNNRNKRNQLGVAWTGPYVDATGPSHSSALDVLVAAIGVAQ